MLISHMLLKPVWKGEHCGAARERTLKALQVVNEKTTVGFFFFFTKERNPPPPAPPERNGGEEGTERWNHLPYLLCLVHGAVPRVGGGKLHGNRADFQGQEHRFLVNLLLVIAFVALPVGIAFVTEKCLYHNGTKRLEGGRRRRRRRSGKWFLKLFFRETIIKTLTPIGEQERSGVKVGVPRIQQGRVMGWPSLKTSKSGGGESQSTATAHAESSSEISQRADNQPEQG